MKYEKAFQLFYDKYYKLYNSDKDYVQSSKYSSPYYNYIVQPRDKYKEPFIHASRFNNDCLTEKIGYEKQEPFPFQPFRLSTPLYKAVETETIPQRSERAYQPKQESQESYKPKVTEAELRYYNDFMKQREQCEQRGRVYQSQHVSDYSVTPDVASRGRYANYQQSNPLIYLQDSNQYRGLSPIQISSINKHTLSVNPYTDKDINIGGTTLNKNPIVYPLDPGRVASKKMYTSSPLLHSTGNNIIHS